MDPKNAASEGLEAMNTHLKQHQEVYMSIMPEWLAGFGAGVGICVGFVCYLEGQYRKAGFVLFCSSILITGIFLP